MRTRLKDQYSKNYRYLGNKFAISVHLFTFSGTELRGKSLPASRASKFQKLLALTKIHWPSITHFGACDMSTEANTIVVKYKSFSKKSKFERYYGLILDGKSLSIRELNCCSGEKD